MRHTVNGWVAVTLMVALIACSNGVVTGSPVPRSSAAVVNASRPDESMGALAPTVTEPLRTTSFLVNPCRLITADQARDLGLAVTGEKAANAASSSCLWWTADKRTSVAVSYMTALTAGLSELYAQHEKDSAAFEYFEPATVAGYSALYADKTRGRDSGACTVTIGVTNGLYAKVQVDYVPQGKDVCDLTARLGESMIATMKQGE